jgi:hypothetical protein
LDYNDETLDYEVFEVTGLPAGCTTDKGDGGIDVQVYFGLNYYDYPPRLDDYVLLLFRVDPEPFEIINCQNASLPQTNLWHDVLRILHRDEVHSSKNALLLTMQIIRQNDSYARYHSNRNLSELQELMEAGEAPLLPVSAFDTVREVMLINLIHTPRPAGG